MSRVLVLDDEENNVAALRRLLRAETDLEIEGFTSAAEALRRADEVAFDVVLADYRMPEMDGTQFLEQFRYRQPDAYRIIVSAHSDVEMLRKAINQAQIHRFIQKPWDGFLLVEAVMRGAERAVLTQEVARLQKQTTQQAGTIEYLIGLLAMVAEKYPDALPADWQAAMPPDNK